MVDRIFVNIVSAFSKLTATLLLSFSYFSIFSVIEVDKNPLTVFGIMFISYLVAESFMQLAMRVYESAVMEELEELIESLVLEEKEKKKYIQNNIRSKFAIQYELNVMLVGFAFLVIFVSTIFAGYFEKGIGLSMLYSRELLSSIFITISMVAILILLMKIMIKFRLSRGLSFLKTLSVNAFVLYITLVFFVFSVIDTLFVLFG